MAAVKDELDNHIQLTRAESGCLIFEVTQDLLNPCRFDVYEEFVDEAAFQVHQARVKSSRWGK
ncbi:putative quinol monooxygenase [Aeromonas veronii]